MELSSNVMHGELLQPRYGHILICTYYIRYGLLNCTMTLTINGQDHSLKSKQLEPIYITLPQAFDYGSRSFCVKTAGHLLTSVCL